MKSTSIFAILFLFFSIYSKSQSRFDTTLHKAYYKAITRSLERTIYVVADFRINSFELISIDIMDNKLNRVEITEVDSVMFNIG
jgi:hypothetical protein